MVYDTSIGYTSPLVKYQSRPWTRLFQIGKLDIFFSWRNLTFATSHMSADRPTLIAGFVTCFRQCWDRCFQDGRQTGGEAARCRSGVHGYRRVWPVAGYAHAGPFPVEPAMHVAHICVDVPGCGHGLLVRATAGYPVGRPYVRGPVEKLKRRVRCRGKWLRQPGENDRQHRRFGLGVGRVGKPFLVTSFRFLKRADKNTNSSRTDGKTAVIRVMFKNLAL